MEKRNSFITGSFGFIKSPDRFKFFLRFKQFKITFYIKQHCCTISAFIYNKLLFGYTHIKYLQTQVYIYFWIAASYPK